MDHLDIEAVGRLKGDVFDWDALDQEALNIYTVLDIIVRDLERGERPSKFALDRARRLISKVRGE